LKQARALGHAETLSEHVLLALLNDREGLAAKILIAHGLELEAVRAEIVKRRGEEGGRG
jgi:ATP-dependent Clp protease ATP-binding subunit ClpC